MQHDADDRTIVSVCPSCSTRAELNAALAAGGYVLTVVVVTGKGVTAMVRRGIDNRVVARAEAPTQEEAMHGVLEALERYHGITGAG